jgi:HK97 family phage major capsid protein
MPARKEHAMDREAELSQDQLVKAVDLLHDASGAFIDTAENLNRRMAHLENGGAPSGKTRPFAGMGKDMGGRPIPFPHGDGRPFARPGVKSYRTGQDEVIEVGPETKLADVLPAKHKPEISLDRWLAATMLGEHCKDGDALDYVRGTKQISGGTTGVLLPEGFQGEWIDNLRSQMVLQAAGMQTATMLQRTVTASRVVSDPPVAWRAEAGALTPGDPTFELRQLVARSVAVRAQATAELAQDSPDFGAQLLNVFSRALAHEIDRVGLVGSGTGNEPTGIHNTTGVGTVAAVGTPADYSAFVTGLQTLLEANVELERANRNAIMSPRTWGTLESLQATDNQPLQRPRALDQMAFRPTTAIPNDLGVGEDESIVILGDFSDLVLGVRMEATVEALRLQSFAENLLLEFVGWARVDFLVRRPASFVVLEGVTVGGGE